MELGDRFFPNAESNHGALAPLIAPNGSDLLSQRRQGQPSLVELWSAGTKRFFPFKRCGLEAKI
jgi:hypothetical protein